MFGTLLKTIGTLVLVGGIGGGVAYWLSLEPVREMTPLMHELATDASQAFAAEIPKVRSVDTTLLVINGRGNRDEEEQFRGMLEGAIRSSSKYSIRTWEDVGDTLDDSYLSQFFAEWNQVPDSPPNTYERACELLEPLADGGFDVDGLLWVEVENFVEGPNQDGLGAQVKLSGRLYASGEKTTVEQIPPLQRGITSPWDYRYLHYRIGQSSFLLRLFGWFVVVTGLPWAGIAVVRWVLNKRDNAWTMSLLIALTVFDVALGWVALFSIGLSGGTVFGLVVVAGLMGYYNYDACDYIDRRLR